MRSPPCARLQELIDHRDRLVAEGRAWSARARAVHEVTEAVRADAMASLLEAANLLAECRSLVGAVEITDKLASQAVSALRSTESIRLTA